MSTPFERERDAAAEAHEPQDMEGIRQHFKAGADWAWAKAQAEHENLRVALVNACERNQQYLAEIERLKEELQDVTEARDTLDRTWDALCAKKNAYREQAERLYTILNHAVELGYFEVGGSTLGWATEALREYEAFKKERGE